MKESVGGSEMTRNVILWNTTKHLHVVQNVQCMHELKGKKAKKSQKWGGGGNDVMYCKQESNLGVNMCKATGHVMMLQTQEDCLYSL